MKLLFVCNQNKHRSKTAEEIFKDRFDTLSAGLFNETPLTEEDIAWADAVIVMEEFQRDEISKRFPKEYLKARVLNLDVPDIFAYMQKELIELLEARMKSIRQLVA